MSCFFVLTPVIAGVAWPVFCALAAAALAQAGFAAASASESTVGAATESVDVDLERSQGLAESLQRDQSLTVRRGDIVVTIHKDARGQCVLHVEGSGKSKAQLKEIGTELMHRITQKYVHEKLKKELDARGFSIAEEENLADRTIRMTVRKWR